MNLSKFRSSLTAKDWLVAIVFFGGLFLATAAIIQVSACSLCQTQKLFMFCGVVAVAVSLVHAQPSRTYAVIAALFWLAGCVVAFRQLWIQYVPGAATNCGPGIDYLIAYEYPLSRIVKTMLTGSGDCAEPSVIPILALFGFLILLAFLFIHLRIRRQTGT